MPRDLPLGNGRLLVHFDRHYAIRDLFFPHVGLENHAMGRPSRVAVHVDGKASWIGDAGWELELDYERDTLVTRVLLREPSLGLEILASDAVDWHHPVLVRRFHLRNLRDSARTVRLFLHHDLDILESDAGNTAFFDPPHRAVIHYKRRRYFLFNLLANGEAGVGSYSCDHRSSHRGRGTAGQVEANGQLDANPISLGAVDSCIMAELSLPAGGDAVAYAWTCVGIRYQDVVADDGFVQGLGPEGVLDRVRNFWRLWCQRDDEVSAELPEDVVATFRRSLLVVRTQTDREGGVLAANDSDTLNPGRETYSYVWPRDGAFVAEAMARAGYGEIAQRFFSFCARHLPDGGYFLHRYHPDGSLASSWLPWIRNGERVLPIQEDETALVLWAIGRYAESGPDEDLMTTVYPRLVRKAADFLCDFRSPATGLPLPSWDLWEERFGVHTFTVASVIAGLRAAAKLAGLFGDAASASRYRSAADEVDAGLDQYLFHKELGRYVRTGHPDGRGYWLDTTVDSSLAGLFLLDARPVDDERVVETMESVREKLTVGTPIGGIARYEGDPYCRVEVTPGRVPGNPWFLCTLWLAEFDIERARNQDELEGPLQTLRWARARALRSGIMAEQLHPVTGAPYSVSPLTWSHAAFVSAASRYAERRRSLREGS